MDSIIQTTPPQSSPILGYGRSSAAPHLKLLAIFAGVFAVFLTMIILCWRIEIHLPERILFAAAVRGGTPLPESVPVVWKRSVEHTSAPSILGIAIVDDRAEPFALTASRVLDSSLRVERSGALSFVSEREIPRRATQSLGRLIFLALRTIAQPAYLTFDLHALDERLTDRIQGPVDASGVWKTDFSLPKKTFADLPSGDAAIDLETFPEAWPLLVSFSGNANFPLEAGERPSAVGWTSSTSASALVDLRWSSPMSSATRDALLASAGTTDLLPYRLPDGVVVDEYRLPQNIRAASDTAILTDREFSTAPLQRGESLRACGDGRPVFRLMNEALNRILPKIGFSAIRSEAVIEFSEAGGKMQVCMKES